MHNIHRFLRIILLVLLVIGAFQTTAQAYDEIEENSSVQDRLVVFEAFMRPT